MTSLSSRHLHRVLLPLFLATTLCVNAFGQAAGAPKGEWDELSRLVRSHERVTVRTNDGRTLSGTISSFTQDSVVVFTDGGNWSIPKIAVRSVVEVGTTRTEVMGRKFLTAVIAGAGCAFLANGFEDPNHKGGRTVAFGVGAGAGWLGASLFGKNPRPPTVVFER